MTLTSSIKGLGSYITARGARPATGAGGVSLTVRSLRPAPLHNLFRATGWEHLMVEVQLSNDSSEDIRIPRGEEAVLADGVGYAYRDRRKVMTAGTLPAGRSKVVRYVFRVPEGSTIGRIILRDAGGEQLAGTGYMDLKVLSPAT